MTIIKDPFVKIEDLPADTVIRIDPDFEAPGIEWRKCDEHRDLPHDEYYNLHNQVDVGNGVAMNSICDASKIEPFVTTERPVMEFVDAPLELYHNPEPTSMVTFEPNNNFVITGDNGEELVCINMATGETTIGPEHNPDDAAQVFWKCIEGFKQPDAWEENANITSTEILREVRGILGCGEGENILDVAKQIVGDAGHKSHCNWHNWDHSCSWSGSDCTCDTVGMAAPGCLDDMPESYLAEDPLNKYFREKRSCDEQQTLARNFDNAMKVVD